MASLEFQIFLLTTATVAFQLGSWSKMLDAVEIQEEMRRERIEARQQRLGQMILELDLPASPPSAATWSPTQTRDDSASHRSDSQLSRLHGVAKPKVGGHSALDAFGPGF